MPVTIAMALVGAGGIAFYVRFLVALSQERQVHKWMGGYWIRMRLESNQDLFLERREERRKESRAA